MFGDTFPADNSAAAHTTPGSSAQTMTDGDATAYVPSPLERERSQVALYEATNGAAGGTL